MKDDLQTHEKELFESLMKKSLQILRKNIAPIKEKSDVIVWRSYPENYKIESVSDKVKKELTVLGEFSQCSGILKKRKFFNKFKGKALLGQGEYVRQATFEYHYGSAQDCLISFVISYFNLNRRFKTKLFTELLENFIFFFNEGKVKYKQSVLLHNLKLPNSSIEFNEMINIRRLSSMEISEQFPYGALGQSVAIDKSTFCVLEVIYEKPIVAIDTSLPDFPIIYGEQKEFENPIRPICTTILHCLNVYSDDFVFPNETSRIEIISGPNIGGFSYKSTFKTRYTEQDRIEDHKKISPFKHPNMVKKMHNKIGKDHKLQLIARKLFQARNKEILEDQILDYVIGLESLLLPGRNQELAFQLSLRGANLLGKNKEEKEGYYKLIKDAYRARNNIVHGNLKASFPVMNVTDLDKVLMTCVQKYIANPKTFTPKALELLYF